MKHDNENVIIERRVLMRNQLNLGGKE